MQSFVLDGDTIKRLLYNKPIINGNDPVDPTTCEVYELYLKNVLLYQRDKTFQTIYVSHKLAESKHDNAGYDYYDFSIAEYSNYNKVTLPVTSDFVTMLQNQENFRFGITQYDFGRNKFWETIVTEINKLVITNRAFTRFLFKNALGLAGLDWATIGDNVYHGLVYDIDVTYPELGQAFTNCDIPNVTINCRRFTQTLGKAFYNSKVKKVKITGAGLEVYDIQGIFEWCDEMERLDALTVKNVAFQLNGRTATFNGVRTTWAFEGCSATYIKLDEFSNGDIIIRPDSYQIFTGNCGVETVDGAAWDFIMINPAEYSFVSAAYGHPIFGNVPIESMKIKNLNKGDWTIPMPLDSTSVIYLLNNVYDLTQNVTNKAYVPTLLNLISNWNIAYYNGNGIIGVRKALTGESAIIDDFDSSNAPIPGNNPLYLWWSYYENSTSLNHNDGVLYDGPKRLVFAFNYPNAQPSGNGLGSLALNVYIRNRANNDDVIVKSISILGLLTPNNDYILDFTQADSAAQLGLGASDLINYPNDWETKYNNGELGISKITLGFENQGDLDIEFKFKWRDDASEVTSANLTFEQVVYNAAYDAAIAVAQARGWAVNFAS